MQGSRRSSGSFEDDESFSSGSNDNDDTNSAAPHSPAASEVDEAFESGIEQGKRILKEIIRQNRVACEPFMEAVDVEGLQLWDYKDIVKKPMWIKLMEEKFEKNEYNHFADFAADFRLMAENCYRYNSTEHPVSKKAKKLELVFEGKLANLNKEIQAASTIAITSGGKFSLFEDDQMVSSTRTGRPSGLGNAHVRYVYDFVKAEEAAVLDEDKASNQRERREQQLLYEQLALNHIESLESRPLLHQIRSNPLLPEIAMFLWMTEPIRKKPEFVLYKLEVGLLTPDQSLHINMTMTSLLCTYYERNLIEQRAPMTYRVWSDRLQQRVAKWFETAVKQKDFLLAAEKLAIHPNFFRCLKWRNPFQAGDESKSFMDLDLDTQLTIIKALCDSTTATKSTAEYIHEYLSKDSRARYLGRDVNGDLYVYFPHFFATDIRIYKHRYPSPYEPMEEDVPLPPGVEVLIDEPEEPGVEDKMEAKAEEGEDSSPVNGTVKKEVKMEVDEMKSSQSSTPISSQPSTPAPSSPAASTDVDLLTPRARGRGRGRGRGRSHGWSSKTKKLAATVSSTCTALVTPSRGRGRGGGRGKKRKIEETVVESPVIPNEGRRRSTRNKQRAQYTDMVETKEVAVAEDDGDDDFDEEQIKAARRGGRGRRGRKSKAPKIESVDEPCGSVEFELAAASHADLVDLVIRLKQELAEARGRKVAKLISGNHAGLVDELEAIQLESEEADAERSKLLLKHRIEVKKEHDLLSRGSGGYDPWVHELTSKSSNEALQAQAIAEALQQVDDQPETRESKRVRRKPQKYEDRDYNPGYLTGSSEEEEYNPNLYSSSRRCPNEKLAELPPLTPDQIPLLPAAYEEFRQVLKTQVNDMRRVLTRYGPADVSDLFTATSGERKTRGKQKEEAKLFLRIIDLAQARTNVDSVSLLSLIRIDQQEMKGIIQQLIIEDDEEKEERKRERQEKRRKQQEEREEKRRVQKQNKEAKIKMEKYHDDLLGAEPQSTIPAIVTSISNTSSPNKPKFGHSLQHSPAHKAKTKNEPSSSSVMVKMNNGKYQHGIRFNDGTVIPIVRDERTQPAVNLNDLVSQRSQASSVPASAGSVRTSTPNISLSGKQVPGGGGSNKPTLPAYRSYGAAPVSRPMQNGGGLVSSKVTTTTDQQGARYGPPTSRYRPMTSVHSTQPSSSSIRAMNNGTFVTTVAPHPFNPVAQQPMIIRAPLAHPVSPAAGLHKPIRLNTASMVRVGGTHLVRANNAIRVISSTTPGNQQRMMAAHHQHPHHNMHHVVPQQLIFHQQSPHIISRTTSHQPPQLIRHHVSVAPQQQQTTAAASMRQAQMLPTSTNVFATTTTNNQTSIIGSNSATVNILPVTTNTNKVEEK